MDNLVGVYSAKRKNGGTYYRSSITYKGRHVSLGSFETAQEAHEAYVEAGLILYDHAAYTIDGLDQYFSSAKKAEKKAEKDFAGFDHLTFDKAVILLNFRDNAIYFQTPIYLYKSYFHYYLAPDYVLTFDKDDLFYYSSHKIMRRGNHLFVSDYGMQVSILSRYGIRSFAVKDRDYCFKNQDDTDFRYRNIEIINAYYGVQREGIYGNYQYHARIHINGSLSVGIYKDAETAAIAYNKAVDLFRQHGVNKNFPVNYIETMSPKLYAEIYSTVKLSGTLHQYIRDHYL